MVDIVQVGDVRANAAKQSREGLGSGAVVDHLSQGGRGGEKIRQLVQLAGSGKEGFIWRGDVLGMSAGEMDDLVVVGFEQLGYGKEGTLGPAAKV